MNKWLEILIGLILIIGAILVAWFSPNWWGDFWNFRHAAWEFFKGGLFWMIALIGLLFLMLGISDLRE
jgi:TRAP-type C4-dicarboxylate transport system permease small subunit